MNYKLFSLIANCFNIQIFRKIDTFSEAKHYISKHRPLPSPHYNVARLFERPIPIADYSIDNAAQQSANDESSAHLLNENHDDSQDDTLEQPENDILTESSPEINENSGNSPEGFDGSDRTMTTWYESGDSDNSNDVKPIIVVDGADLIAFELMFEQDETENDMLAIDPLFIEMPGEQQQNAGASTTGTFFNNVRIESTRIGANENTEPPHEEEEEEIENEAEQFDIQTDLTSNRSDEKRLREINQNVAALAAKGETVVVYEDCEYTFLPDQYYFFEPF